MAEAGVVRHLRVVTDDGEILDEHPEVAELQIKVRMLERERAGQRLKIFRLEQDKAKKRAEHPRRQDIERVHSYWQRKCKHPRAGLDDADFFAIAAMMELKVKGKPEFDWPRDFKAAVDGAAFDPFITKRKNGSCKRHDDLGLIFRDAAHMREFIAKAPCIPVPEAG